MMIRRTTRIIYPGEKIGSWEVLGRDKKASRIKYICRCKCGIEKSIFINNLLDEDTFNCNDCHKKLLSEKKSILDFNNFLAFLDYVNDEYDTVQE